MSYNDGALVSVSKQIIVKEKNVIPVAGFKVRPSSGRAPLSVSLDASASKDADGKIESYEWILGDQTKASGKLLNHVFDKKGKYTVKLTVTDDDGVPVTISKDIAVKAPNILPSIKMFATPLSGKAPLQIRTNAYGSKDSDGKIKSFRWSYGDSKQDQGLNTEHVYTEQGTYELKLTVTDDDGGTRTQTKKVVVYPANKLPEATFTITPEKGKAPLKVSLDASESFDSDGQVVGFGWDLGDRDTTTGKKVSHPFTRPGTDTI